MVPRNKRKIPPLDLAQFIELFTSVENFSGNVQAQDELSRVLEKANLKGGELQYHPNSGGMRTYASQMEALGLIFKYEGRYYPTISGQHLIDAESPLHNLQLNLLRHQYPSVYGRGQNVRMHPDIRVKPFLFLLELMQSFSYLTVEEMMVPVVYGHSQGHLAVCCEKISALRAGKIVLEVIDNPEEDLFTPKTAGKSIQSRIRDVKDIANTFKNYLESTGLISDSGRFGDNKKYALVDSLDSMVAKFDIKADEFIELDTSPMNFTRRYGRAGRQKDNRRIVGSSRNRNPIQIALIAKYRQLLEADFERSDDSIITQLADDWGMSTQEVQDSLITILGQRDQWFESEYLRLSTGGQKTAIAFEKATTRILNRCAESSSVTYVAEHVGQRRASGLGGFADILVKGPAGTLSLIDAKAIASYCLPHDDIVKMSSTYLTNYPQLLDEGSQAPVTSIAYVSASLCSSIEVRLRLLNGQTGTRSTAFSARTLYSTMMSGQGTHIADLLFGNR